MTISQAAGVWHSRAGDTPAAVAYVFRQAAKVIRADGYAPCADSIHVDRRDRGHNISTALDAAAALACPCHGADAADLAEDAHARLAGFLYLTGLRTRRMSIHDMCDEIAVWEEYCPGEGWRTEAQAIAILDAAAAVLDGIGQAADGCAVSGPFETQRQAVGSARHITGSPPGAWKDGNLRLLEEACRAARVQLGAYDSRILVWLAGWEPWACAVVAGLITRAHAGVLDEDDRRTALDALDVAADHKRDLAANCGDCEARPEGLCPACEWRMDAADAYDRAAAKLRGGQ
jgi:hypothetical protein